MLNRFLQAFLWFAGLVVPTAFALALLAAPAARPEPAIPPGCDRSLADATANVATMKTRVRTLADAPLLSRAGEGTRRHRAVQERRGTRSRSWPLRCRCRAHH